MLNIAIVGLGWWGKTLVNLAGTSNQLKVVRVVDVNPAMAALASEKGIAFSTRFEDALNDSNVQGVVLCTPHTQHTEQIIACAAAAKHVFCEKPLSMTRADVIRAVKAVEAAGVTLAVGHEKRFEPPVLELMSLLNSGVLGTPLQVEANFSQDKFLSMAADNWRLSPQEAPAGPMTATGIHILDLSVGVFGEAHSAFASVKQLGSALTNGDTLAALVTFKSGGHALITAILATPFAGRFALYGSKGWVEIRDKTHPEAPEGWTLTTCLRGEPIAVKDIAPAPAVLHNLEAFAGAAMGGQAYPVPHSQMIANVSALEAIFKSAKSGAIELVG
jgi:predicted dehydrogenase